MDNDVQKITAARITALPAGLFDALPIVYVTVGGFEEKLFVYYPDEIQFCPAELVGLTVAEAHALKGRKDREYLRT